MPDRNLVARWERLSTVLGRKIADGMLALQDAQGPKPFGAVDLSRQDQAQHYLGDWLALGNSKDPATFIPYWQGLMHVDPDKPDGGPAAAYAFHARMTKLWEDPRTTLQATLGMGPQTRETYWQQRAAGLHSGEPTPKMGGTHGAA